MESENAKKPQCRWRLDNCSLHEEVSTCRLGYWLCHKKTKCNLMAQFPEKAALYRVHTVAYAKPVVQPDVCLHMAIEILTLIPKMHSSSQQRCDSRSKRYLHIYNCIPDILSSFLASFSPSVYRLYIRKIVLQWAWLLQWRQSLVMELRANVVNVCLSLWMNFSCSF